MTRLSRRSVLRASLGLAAAGTLARPYIANAAATTATAWWVQGFIPEEDVAFRKLVADYQKASGNTIDYNIVPFAPLRNKIVSAITSGVVPDIINATPPEIVPESAWRGQLVDVTDVVDTQKSKFLPPSWPVPTATTMPRNGAAITVRHLQAGRGHSTSGAA